MKGLMLALYGGLLFTSFISFLMVVLVLFAIYDGYDLEQGVRALSGVLAFFLFSWGGIRFIEFLFEKEKEENNV